MYYQSSSSFTSVQSNGKRHTKTVNTYIKEDKGILVIGETDNNGEIKYKMRHLKANEVENIKKGKFIKNLCENGNCRTLSRNEVQNIEGLIDKKKRRRTRSKTQTGRTRSKTQTGRKRG